MAPNDESSSSDTKEECCRCGRNRWLSSGNRTTANNVAAFLQQIAWVVAPLKPFYDSVKFISPIVLSCFTLAEDIVSQIVDFLCKPIRDSRNEPANPNPEGEHTTMFLDSFINWARSCVTWLYKFWFQVHHDLGVLVNYLGNLFEEIVPLVPGDRAWNDLEKENLSIRERCFYIVVNAFRRLFYHTRKFLENNMAFQKIESSDQQEK